MADLDLQVAALVVVDAFAHGTHQDQERAWDNMQRLRHDQTCPVCKGGPDLAVVCGACNWDRLLSQSEAD